MTKAKRYVPLTVALAVLAVMAVSGQPAAEFVPLFNGRDLTGWKIPAGDNGHWRVVDGVIDYDAESEAPGDKSLWSSREFGDFVLRADWRIKSTPYVNPSVPIIRFDGTHKKDAIGQGDPNRRAGFRLGHLSTRLEQGAGQHLGLADRLR